MVMLSLGAADGVWAAAAAGAAGRESAGDESEE